MGVIVLSGCAIDSRAVAGGFVCRGRASEPIVWPKLAASGLPVGRFELKAIDPPAGSVDGNLKRRVQISADAVPLGTVAQRLAEATGVSIIVSAALVELRVSMSSPSVTVDALLGLIEAANPVHRRTAGDALMLTSSEEWWRHRQGMICPEDLVVQVIPIADHSRLEQLGTMVCDQMLSDRGSLAVVGDSLVVRDVGSVLTRVRATVQVLDPPWVPAEAQ